MAPSHTGKIVLSHTSKIVLSHTGKMAPSNTSKMENLLLPFYTAKKETYLNFFSSPIPHFSSQTRPKMACSSGSCNCNSARTNG